MSQKQSKNIRVKNNFVDEGSAGLCDKELNQETEKLKNYKAFFRYLLSDDSEVDDELVDEALD